MTAKVPAVGSFVREFVEGLDKVKLGKVIYVHPSKRWYSVEYEGKRGKFRESAWAYGEKRIPTQKGRRSKNGKVS